MRILFISVTAGEGHNAFARAIIDYYKENYSDVECKLIDLFKPKHKVHSFLNNEFTFFTFRHFPRLMSLNYKLSTKRKVNPDINYSLSQAKCAKEDILKVINEYQPDAIFTTHTYSTALINYLNRKKIINIPSFSLIPDFVIHPDVENNIDSNLCFVSNKYVSDEIISRGFDPQKIIVSGLPINPSFNKINDINLNLDPNKKTVLVMFGGMGLHKNHIIVKKLIPLLDKINLIVINGKDKKSYRRIKKINNPNVINLEYVSDVASIMAKSNLLIGKVGGASTSEAFHFNLPIVVPFPAYFQENASIKLLESLNIVKKSSLRTIDIDVKILLNMQGIDKNIYLIHNDLANKIIAEKVYNYIKK